MYLVGIYRCIGEDGTLSKNASVIEMTMRGITTASIFIKTRRDFAAETSGSNCPSRTSYSMLTGSVPEPLVSTLAV